MSDQSCPVQYFTPPPSPESASSSSDGPHKIIRERVSGFSGMSPSRGTGTSSLPSSSFSCSSTEPTSSTNGFSSPMMASQNSSTQNGERAMAYETGNSNSDRTSIAFISVDQFPSSSKNTLNSNDNFCSSCSANHFPSEVSSSSMDIDLEPQTSSTKGDSSDMEYEATYNWVPDSSEGSDGTKIPAVSATSEDIPLDYIEETVVSRSTWQVDSSKSNTKVGSKSNHWSSEVCAYGADASNVSSSLTPDEHGTLSFESVEHTASTSTWSRNTVNSSVEIQSSNLNWLQESSEGAVGLACQQNRSSNSIVMKTNNSSLSPSSTSMGICISPSPLPPPISSSFQSGPAANISSTHHYSSNPNINSTSVPQEEVTSPMSWRARASSSPIRLTRVTPTTPPPRPPTPPCSGTPSGRARAMQSQYPSSSRRSISPQDRLRSPSNVRRSISPPLRHGSRSTPPTPNRRSVSPPLRGRGLTQRLTSARRSLSPVSHQQPLIHPPSPSGRHRLSPRPRSARTPSPRPPRPPNSTPEPSPNPSPSQQSPRPYNAKMRGR